MYNETVRKHEAYYGSLLYERKEGIKQGRAEGRAEGIEQGIEQERLKNIQSFAKMVRNRYLTKELAAEGLGISVEDFEKYL